ncbi:type II secretion system F family protein [Aliidiomarina quisquiliarum]|uniref:type II secretion system F family protein n=1 Tax=Aliidiomarina quisquiliarum TaxID=2938947 RepID=UPI00208DF91D|nr:type II secretion system F family protein [Aliidiomarina quisquiliarum]MCO4321477.1 type II secretion system F family protein [Aliidiomarina quisquiliarum]
MKAIWYRWHGHPKDDAHDLRQGVLQAHHSTGVALQLWQQQIHLTRRIPLPTTRQGYLPQLAFWASWFSRWHSLIKSGFDMAQSLQQLHNQSMCQAEAELSQAALQALHKGLPISYAFKRSPLPLNNRYLQLMEFAEQAGQFEHVLAQLSVASAERQKRALQLRQAMRYPAAVLAMVVLLGVGLKLFILPKFAALYAETNAQLPFLTQLLLQPASNFQLSFFVALLFMLGGLGLLVQLWLPFWLAKPGLRRWLMRNPSWHKYVELTAVQQDLHTLALGLQHGMTLQQSIISVALTHSSTWHQGLWLQSLQTLKAGKNSRAIFNYQYLTSTEYALIELGEQTGTLEDKIMQVAKDQQQAIAQRLQNSLQLLPNLVLIVVSIITGAVMIALYLPLFQLGLAVG